MRQLAAALIALLLLPAAVARADPFDDVFADYQADGRVDPCAHTAEELDEAKRDIPNDIDQYAPELPGQLDAAIAQREQGACDAGATAPATTPTAPSTTAAPPPATTPTTPTTPAQTAPPAMTPTTTTAAAPGGVAGGGGDDDDGAGAALAALAAAGALLLLAALVWGLFRLFAWEPPWLLDARHAVAEAGWRTSGAWADFTDWLRSRRSAP
ncbi:MAG TPA: hypothetical protein VGW75_13965 [Solirubrobacteraceae bacterium]|jgi:hypothetical protein|nr:hypothetical protein [Solirubrobacteraceae bacterium]